MYKLMKDLHYAPNKNNKPYLSTVTIKKEALNDNYVYKENFSMIHRLNNCI